jgi:pSer/pThr/pTyr-binding forkhead associated (FHA) protein
MLQIIIKLNNTVIKEFNTDQNEIIIGREPSSDVQIDNIAISREHACIVKGPNDCFIEDMNSKNGIFINGKKINKKFLKTNDEITIGKYSLQIVLEEDPAIRKNRKTKAIDTTYRMGAAEYKKILKH